VRRAGIVLVLGVVGLGCEQPSCGLGRLESVLSDLAGSGARDCGFVLRGTDSSAANDCVAGAIASGAAFRVRYEWGDPPPRQWTLFNVEGIARARDGRMWSVDLDAKRCGPQPCEGLILSAECRNEFTFRRVDCHGFCASSISCARQVDLGQVCAGD
jgi:hypothetical protein